MRTNIKILLLLKFVTLYVKKRQLLHKTTQTLKSKAFQINALVYFILRNRLLQGHNHVVENLCN